MLKVYVALRGDKFLEEKSIGNCYIGENNVWPRKLQMLEAERVLERLSIAASPVLEVSTFGYLIEHDTGLIASLGLPSIAIASLMLVSCVSGQENMVF